MHIKSLKGILKWISCHFFNLTWQCIRCDKAAVNLNDLCHFCWDELWYMHWVKFLLFTCAKKLQILLTLFILSHKNLTHKIFKVENWLHVMISLILLIDANQQRSCYSDLLLKPSTLTLGFRALIFFVCEVLLRHCKFKQAGCFKCRSTFKRFEKKSWLFQVTPKT